MEKLRDVLDVVNDIAFFAWLIGTIVLVVLAVDKVRATNDILAYREFNAWLTYSLIVRSVIEICRFAVRCRR